MTMNRRHIPGMLCILVCMALLGGCAHRPQPPVSSLPPVTAALPADMAEGSLLLHDASPASLDDFLRHARQADFILLGEGHTVPCDHLIQSRLLQALAESGIRPAVGLEMLSTDRQPALDAVNNGTVPLANFADAVDWKKEWGYPFDLYRPVFETVYAHRLPLHALNVPQRIVRKVSRGGVSSLSDEERALLPERIIPASDAQREALQDMVNAHKAMRTMRNATRQDVPSPSATDAQPDAGVQPGTGAQTDSGPQADSGTQAESGTQADAAAQPDRLAGSMERFFLVQSLWDTAMAEQAIAAHEARNAPVVVLIGAGHVEFGWGLAHRIRTLRPESTVLMLTPWRGTEPVDPQEADMRFFCRLAHKSRMGFTLVQTEEGALVESVNPGSRAEQAGFEAGDVILSVNGTPTDSMWVLHRAGAEAAKSNTPLAFDIRRGEARLTLSVSMPSRQGPGQDAGTDNAPDNAPDSGSDKDKDSGKDPGKDQTSGQVSD